MAAPTRNLFGTDTTGATNSTTLLVEMSTMASGATVNDVIYVFCASDGTALPNLDSQSSTDGWIRVDTHTDSAQCAAALYRFRVVTAGTVPDLTITNSSEMMVAHVFRLRASSGNTVNHIVGTKANGSSTNPNPGLVSNNTGATKDFYYIAMWAGDGNNVLSTVAPTNYANHQSTGIANANGCAIGTADRTRTGITNGTSEDPGTFTRTTEQWATLTVAFYEEALPTVLSINDAVSGSATDNVTLAPKTPLAVDDATSAAAADNLTLTANGGGSTSLVINDATSAGLLSNLVVTYIIPKKLAEEGDSLTVAAGSWGDVWINHRAAAGYTSVNVATGGQGIDDVVASMDTQIFGNNPEVVGVFLQANDLAGTWPGGGAECAEAILSDIVDPIRARGIKVVCFTSLPQAAPAGNPSIHNPRRPAFDQHMRDEYAAGRFEGLVDIAADPILGPDAAASDTGLYNDGLHMTGYGYERLGQRAIPALDEAFGYASDTTPAAFSIADTHANASTVSYTAYITPTGFDSPTPISVTGGAEIEINDSGYWATADLLPIGGYFRLRRTSGASAGTVTSTVDVGGVTADWDLITVNGTLWTIGDLTTAPIGLFDLRNRASATVSAGFCTTLQNLGSQSSADATQGNGGLTF
jgi:hypothetical protein